MDITPQFAESMNHITQYGDGGFTISGEKQMGSVLVFADRVVPWDGVISAESLQACAQDTIDILLIGCGETGAFIVPELRAHFKMFGVSIDAMDTGAACRTFNILMSESRRVVAALVAI